MEKVKNRTVYLLRWTDKPDDWTDVYVGSTSQPLNYRLCCHKYSAKNFLRRGYTENNLYTRMSRVGVQNWKVIPLLTFACDINKICEFEKAWVAVLNANLNTNSPVREEKTVQEYKVNYYKANKEAIRVYQKEYYKANKKAVREYQKEYYKSNKEAIRQKKRQTTTI